MLLGVKYLDYLDWCKIANLKSEGKHLTYEGLKLIKEINYGTGKTSSCRWESPTADPKESKGTDRKT
jgi:hypothetical protein